MKKGAKTMTRVFLADDEQLALSGVKYMLDRKSMDCEIVGTHGGQWAGGVGRHPGAAAGHCGLRY